MEKKVKMENPNVLEKLVYKNVSWLIKNCNYAQTPGMLEYFKSLKPYAWDVSDLITNCNYAQTPGMVEYYKSLINE